MGNPTRREPQWIYRPVYYDRTRKGYCYQMTARSPLRGPFSTRAGAVADASWHTDELSPTWQPHR